MLELELLHNTRITQYRFLAIYTKFCSMISGKSAALKAM